LIHVVKENSSGDLTAYKNIISHYQVNWIINPYSISLTEINGKKTMLVKFQLYFNPDSRLFINTTLSVNESEISKSCNDGIMHCLMSEMVQKIKLLVTDRLEKAR